ncbi:hypothetical protein BpHYR1_047117 [Brachionus plicatilis]|uniref:Uncharacterized protein n=1 Tax=Brachionus plicatilis TaxID=10195 RepID=A0A3M7Q0G6_BRAPC|nr:hypothetical protein BpHYR1_047117 [Brachionus plicatilis]
MFRSKVIRPRSKIYQFFHFFGVLDEPITRFYRTSFEDFENKPEPTFLEHPPPKIAIYFCLLVHIIV